MNARFLRLTIAAPLIIASVKVDSDLAGDVRFALKTVFTNLTRDRDRGFPQFERHWTACTELRTKQASLSSQPDDLVCEDEMLASAMRT